MKTITITLTDEEIQGLKDCLEFGLERLRIYSQNSKKWKRLEKMATISHGKVMDAIEASKGSNTS